MINAVESARVVGPADPPYEERTVGDLLRRAAAAVPDRDALVEGSAVPGARRRWTYAQLLADAEECARALLVRYRPGDKVAIWSPNIPEYQVLQYGLALAGMVMVTVNPAFRRPELRYALEDADVVACFAARSYRERPLLEVARRLRSEVPMLQDVFNLEDLGAFRTTADPSIVLPLVAPNAIAQILFTSGTTGAPKGAMLPHRGMANNVAEAARIIAAGEKQHPVWLATLPMFHLASCVVATVGSCALLGTVVTVERFDAALALRLIEEERVTMMNQVPTLLVAMMEHPSRSEWDLSSFRSVMLGGAPVPAELVRRLEAELGIATLIGYGMTEAAHITITRSDDRVEDKAESCGLPLPGVEIELIDPVTKERRGYDEVGEVLTRGGHITAGYYGKPEASAEVIDEDGWLHTGDLGTLDRRGYLRIVGRAKDMIIRGGENVYPREVEEELLLFDEIEEVAVVGLPDPYYGEIIAAFVHPRDGAAILPADLASRLGTRLTGYKIPARWFVVDQFPRTASGKVQKFVLRDAWERGELDEVSR